MDAAASIRRRSAHADSGRRSVYETACALAESATLVEAAPRMLEAICEALGWEYGALWEVDRAATCLRCVATWHPPSLPFDEFAAATAGRPFARGVGLPGRVWASRAAGLDSRRRRTTRTSRARHSPTASACMRRSASRSCRGADGPRRSWSSSAGTSASPTRTCWRCWRRSAARSACSSSGSGPRRSWTGSSRCRWTCCASPTSTATSSA